MLPNLIVYVWPIKAADKFGGIFQLQALNDVLLDLHHEEVL